MKDTSIIHVDEVIKAQIQEIRRMLKGRRKGRQSMNDAMIHIMKVYHHKLKQIDLITRDEDLDQKCGCAFRFLHEAMFFCGKDAPKIKQLLTLKVCLHCKSRLDQELYLHRIRELQKSKITLMQADINQQMSKIREDVYPSCEPDEKFDEIIGDTLIKSSKCPEEKEKDEWHLLASCDPACPFLKKLKKKILKKKAEAT